MDKISIRIKFGLICWLTLFCWLIPAPVIFLQKTQPAQILKLYSYEYFLKLLFYLFLILLSAWLSCKYKKIYPKLLNLKILSEHKILLYSGFIAVFICSLYLIFLTQQTFLWCSIAGSSSILISWLTIPPILLISLPSRPALAKNIILSLYILIGFFIIGEVTLRIYGDLQFSYIREGYNPTELDMENYYQINSFGMRDVEFTLEKPADSIRILVLGDSITWGQGVQLEDTYVKQLQKLLNQKKTSQLPTLNCRYEVLNAGVPGWNTQQELAFLQDKGLSFKPDLVLIGFVLNDAESADNKFYYEVINLLPPPFDKLFLWSYFYLYLQDQFNLLLDVLDFKKSYADFILDLYQDQTKGWLNCQEALNAIALIGKDNKIPVILVIFPLLSDFSNYQFIPIHEKIASTAKAAGIDSLDLYPKLKNYKARSLWVSALDSHPSALMHKVVAEDIYEYLKQNQLDKYLEEQCQ